MSSRDLVPLSKIDRIFPLVGVSCLNLDTIIFLFYSPGVIVIVVFLVYKDMFFLLFSKDKCTV